MSTAAPVLTLRSASFGYADRPVVSDVSLQLHAGEVIAVLGPNGSGKSTIVKGVLGLARQFGGDVDVLGMPLSRLRDRTRLGYVPQRHTLASSVRATVREVVSSGRLPRQSWWPWSSAADRAAVTDALDLVGLADRARTDVTALSGGQHRRVLIARALAGEPDVLLMDEPLAGVDPRAQQELAGVLGRLAGTGASLVIVTHELAAIAGLVTRVVVVDLGRVTFAGSKAAFEAHAGHLLRDHGAHHHDDDPGPDEHPAAGLAPVQGPLGGNDVR